MENTVSGKTYIGKVEKTGFVFAALGQGAMYAMMTSWLNRFYTDVLGLELLFVMGLMWGARIVFALGDPIMGALVDRTRTRFGKMRQYLLFSPFIVSVLSVFLFADFGLDITGKMIYAAVTYIVWGIAYAICDVPFWGLPYAMTPNVEERNKFLSLARTLNSIGGALPIAVVALLISDSILGLRNGLLAGAIIFAAVAVVPFSLTAFYTRERIEPQKERLPVKDSLGLMFKCKPLIFVMLFGVLSFGRYMIQASYTYAADYVFDYNETVSGFTAFVYESRQIFGAALIGLGMFPSMILMPRLLRRFGTRTLSIAAGVGSGIILGLFYLVGRLTDYNFYVAIPFLFLGGMPLGLYNIITFSLAGECIDYIEYKFSIRSEGVVSSAISFVGKVASATAAGVIPLVLELSDYVQPETVDGVTVIMEQSDSAKNAIFMLMSAIPAISLALSAIPMVAYSLVGRKKAEMEKVLEEQHYAKLEMSGALPEVGTEADAAALSDEASDKSGSEAENALNEHGREDPPHGQSDGEASESPPSQGEDGE